ncbi:hypothetical protein OPQ81_011816 [Rhizoctonia solani]|nr:hypothetical protein OPQ81_011816 [Rhizoctonia solani]
MFTLAIALHTFFSIWFNRRLGYRPLFWVTYSACVWVYVVFFALVAWATHKDKRPENGFFAPTPFWCWVNSYYSKQRFGEYFWLWVAGVGNLVIYTLLAVLLGGCFVYQTEEDTEERRELRREGWLQLLNPLGYTILVLPASVARWMYISSLNPPSVLDPNMSSLATATLVFHSTFRLSGLINVLLVLSTRSGLLLINSSGELHPNDPRRQMEEMRATVELEQPGPSPTHSIKYS